MKEQGILHNYQTVLKFLLICWALFFLEHLYPLSHLGIIPRTRQGLIGILTSPFLHGDLNHLISNSSGLLIFGFGLALANKQNFLKVSLKIIIIGGVLTWCFGRPAIHIGASGLIFGLFGHLSCIGFFQKKIKFIFVSLLTIFLYGGMILGVLPTKAHISFEAHLFGFFAGLLTARSQAKALRNS